MDREERAMVRKAMRDLESNKEKYRNRAFHTLLPISEKNPEFLYPEWEKLIKILKKEEVSNKYVAIPLIANLVGIDSENKFEQIFDEFYHLIVHESPVVSPHIAAHSGKIILARPHLQQKILEILFTTDERSQCRHKELLKAYVIDALDVCFSVLDNKDEVIAFVEKQILSDSPKTRKRAKAFLEKNKPLK